ncbi:DUF1294 domain-containing protein [Microbacterium endophyticum]|uniref:DUF1294 domain-containing protein n=1 Tax=Microbacterium endophyticum TaxID=1526412 RepID=UPI0013EB0CE0
MVSSVSSPSLRTGSTSLRRGHRRWISEQMLLTLGLFGRWPGALIAKQLFRHKPRKRSFRRAFRGHGCGQRCVA